MRLFRAVSALSAFAAVLLLSACSSGSPKVRTYPLGDKVDLGRIVYTVFETRWETQLPQEPTPRLPQHRFFLVRINVVNGGSSEVILPNLQLVDDSGQTYDELSNGEGVPQWAGYLRQVKPQDSVQGNVVFDAPPKHYKLRIADDSGQRVALIDIPLSFNAETPDVPIPGSEKK